MRSFVSRTASSTRATNCSAIPNSSAGSQEAGDRGYEDEMSQNHPGRIRPRFARPTGIRHLLHTLGDGKTPTSTMVSLGSNATVSKYVATPFSNQRGW
jgi:hypothetical protein